MNNDFLERHKEEIFFFLRVFSVVMIVCGVGLTVWEGVQLYRNDAPPPAVTCYNQLTGLVVPCPEFHAPRWPDNVSYNWSGFDGFS